MSVVVWTSYDVTTASTCSRQNSNLARDATELGQRTSFNRRPGGSNQAKGRLLPAEHIISRDEAALSWDEGSLSMSDALDGLVDLIAAKSDRDPSPVLYSYTPGYKRR